MVVPNADLTNMNSFFDWILHTGDVTFFGYQGFMMVMMVAVLFGIMMLFNANRFTVFGFMGVSLFGIAILGYTIFGWIAILGILLAGLLLGLALIRIYGA